MDISIWNAIVTTKHVLFTKIMEYNDDGVPRWVERFYNGLWDILKVLLIIAFIAAIIFGRILFDKWYVNWLMK